MNDSGWTLNRPAADHERFGLPVRKDGVFLSRAKVSPEIIRKAGRVLDALFEFQEIHGFEIHEDSEHSLVFLDLKNGFTVAYENADHHKVGLLDSGSFLVGYLTKT